MQNIGFRELALISTVLALSSSIAAAIVLRQTVRYEHPVRVIKGKITSLGQVIPAKVWVDVYNNAQVSLNYSLPPAERRKKQTKVASVEPDDTGEFNIGRLPKGFYEVEVGNHGTGGYEVLSVLVNVDPKGTDDELCVDLGLEGGSHNSSVAKCNAN